MKVVFFVLLSLLAVLTIILIKSKYKVLFLFHLKNKSAYYTLNHRLFSLIQGKLLVLEDGGISIMIKKNKILSKKTEEGFGEIFAKELLKKMQIERIDVYLDQGKFGSMMLTALLGGGTKSIAGIISALLNNTNIQTDFHILTTENKNEFSVAVNTNIRISLLAGFICYIKAKKLLKDIKKEKEKYAKV